jgi:hypothetical protein
MPDLAGAMYQTLASLQRPKWCEPLPLMYPERSCTPCLSKTISSSIPGLIRRFIPQLFCLLHHGLGGCRHHITSSESMCHVVLLYPCLLSPNVYLLYGHGGSSSSPLQPDQTTPDTGPRVSIAGQRGGRQRHTVHRRYWRRRAFSKARKCVQSPVTPSTAPWPTSHNTVICSWDRFLNCFFGSRTNHSTPVLYPRFPALLKTPCHAGMNE